MERNRKRILLISSVDNEQKELLAILFQLGFYLDVVNDLETAIQKNTVTAPDIILCDHRINEYTALEVFNFLNRRIDKLRIPFILISKNLNSAELLMAEELGVDGFLLPPFEADNVRNIIERQFQKRDYHAAAAENKYRTIWKLMPYAIFVVENRRIKEGNEAFYKTFGHITPENKQPFLKDVFNFKHVKAEEMRYVRFMNGLLKGAVFKSLPIALDSGGKYDVHLSNLEHATRSMQMLGIAIPADTTSSKVHLNFKNCLCNYSDEEVCVESQDRKHADSVFTKREKQVLELSAKGISIKEIAHHLGISVRTVEKHRSNVIQKTNSGNIIGAVHFAKTNYSFE